MLTGLQAAWFGGGVIWAGALALFVALLWFTYAERGYAGGHIAEVPPARTWLVLLLVAIALGAVLRLTGLDLKSISHPEVYIPGIALPLGISEPPPRFGFIETFIWHFREEPHPMGYYLGMWGWTKLFGASAWAIRLPEALMGIASIYVMYRLGRASYGVRAGVIAALLLAAHGFHLYWSQIARMYVPGALFGLVSTWLLIEMAKAKRPRRSLEIAWLLTVLGGASTVEFFWPLLAVQMLWTALNAPDLAGSRIFRVQLLGMLLVLPSLVHDVMLGGGGFAPVPTPGFLRDFFSFGFLFGDNSDFAPRLGGMAALALLALALPLIVNGLRVPVIEPVDLPAQPLPARAPLWLAAAGACAVVAGIMLIAWQRQRAIAGLLVLPWLLLAVPPVAGWLRPWLGFADGWRRKLRPLFGLVPLLALVPALLLWAASHLVPVTAPRAFLIFVPYLLIVVAAGVAVLPRWLGIGVAALLALVFAVSIRLARAEPVSPRDYKTLALTINAKSQSGDLLFVPPLRWDYAPLFFYLNGPTPVAGDYALTLRRHPQARVWVPEVTESRIYQPPPELKTSLAGYRTVTTLTAQNFRAKLYVPPAEEP